MWIFEREMMNQTLFLQGNIERRTCCVLGDTLVVKQSHHLSYFSNTIRSKQTASFFQSLPSPENPRYQIMARYTCLQAWTMEEFLKTVELNFTLHLICPRMLVLCFAIWSLLLVEGFSLAHWYTSDQVVHGMYSFYVLSALLSHLQNKFLWCYGFRMSVVLLPYRIPEVYA